MTWLNDLRRLRAVQRALEEDDYATANDLADHLPLWALSLGVWMQATSNAIARWSRNA